jgi:hypothetical protein
MNAAIWAATVGGLATLLVATISHLFSRRREYQLKNLQFKLDRYADFLGGFAEIGSEQKTHEAHLRIASAVNTMNLFASREVLEHVYALLEYVRSHQDQSYSRERQEEIIRKIIVAIRSDLGGKTSDLSNFAFRMISPASSGKSELSNSSRVPQGFLDSINTPRLVDETRGILSGTPSLSEELKRETRAKDKWQRAERTLCPLILTLPLTSIFDCAKSGFNPWNFSLDILLV